MEELMSVAEASRMLGVSRPTIYRWDENGRLKIYRIGGIPKVKKTDVEKILQEAELLSDAEK